MCQGGFGDIAPLVVLLLAGLLAITGYCTWQIMRRRRAARPSAAWLAGACLAGLASAYLATILLNAWSQPASCA